MKRRHFITLLGGAAAAWPFAARAQSAKLPTIGFLGPSTPLAMSQWVAAFAQRLRELGWTEGRTVAVEYRWAEGRSERLAEIAAEFVRLKVDVIVTYATPPVIAAKQATGVIPIVAAVMGDPVGTGLVDSLARPGGNVTGFMNYEYSLSAKWLELLKEIAPNITRVAVLRDPTFGSSTSQFAVIQAAAPSFRTETIPVNVRDAGEIERAVAAFAHRPNGCLIATATGQTVAHRDLIVTLAARHKLPTVYYERFFVAAGGLMSYGPDQLEQYRRAAGYVDRILKGEKPADLPVQAPTKFDLVINLKTAKALGLAVPPTLLARADEVIE